MITQPNSLLRLLKLQISACFPLRVSLLLIFVIQVSALSGCARFKEWNYLPAKKAEERTIHVVSRGRHTGVVLARRDMIHQLGFLGAYLPKTPYYEFGWGEEVFYQAETNTVGMALKALLWRNNSVMHVSAVPGTPAKHFNPDAVVELNVSETGLEHLVTALRASFKLDENNHPYPLVKGLYGESRFFKAEGYYLIFNTCNRWTATILNKGGVPMDTIFTLRSKSLIRQAEEAKRRYFCCSKPVGKTATNGMGMVQQEVLEVPVMVASSSRHSSQPVFFHFIAQRAPGDF